MSIVLNSFFKKLILIFSLALLSACASLPGGPTEGDPLESYNRAMFGFNEGLDKYLLKPVAEGYDAALPNPIKTGFSNFFSNIGDLFVIINDLLQFKFKQAFSDMGRFLFNSTLGLYGLFDISTPMGLPKHNEDFGQTLAAWGVGQGPYVVLPFFGSRTMRGTAGFIVESNYDPVYATGDKVNLYSTVALQTIDIRYKLLKASRIVDQAALDKYSFIRDAYLQHRNNLVYDGNPPEDTQTQMPESSAEELEMDNQLELDLEKELGL